MTPEKFKHKRIKAGLTQKDAAKMLHVNIRTLQRWESGESPIDYCKYKYFILMT